MVVRPIEIMARFALALKEAKIKPEVLLEVLTTVKEGVVEDIGFAPGIQCSDLDWLPADDTLDHIRKMIRMLEIMESAEMF